MGKSTGFLEFERREDGAEAPKSRVKHWGEFHRTLPKEDRMEQGGRCMNCGVPFCQSGVSYGGDVFGCPLHNLIPEWNDMLWSDNFGHALSRLLKQNNFPEFTGRVCPALCEQACTCAVAGKPAVTVRENELGIIEDGFANGRMVPNVPKVHSGCKVAIVGSGPAGLACADQLNHRGHSVTVFEREDRVGGLLTYGIPNMKLDKDIVDRRVRLMRFEGVEFRTNSPIVTKEDAEKLLADYDAVVLACGAEQPRPYAAASTDIPGVSFAVPYLKAATKTLLDGVENPLDAKDKHVVIIGAGYTSSDCVATAIRQGCASVTQIIRKPAELARQRKGLWGKLPEEHDYAIEEAVAVFGTDPRQYETVLTGTVTDEETGVLKAVKIVDVQWIRVDGIVMMEELTETEREIPADLLLIANGFSGCDTTVLDAFGLEPDSRGNLCLEGQDSHATAREGVFTAGDMRRGASLVVWAIAEGRATARDVVEYLTGYRSL